MLPMPNLDDKTFEQLVEDAKKLISQYAPAWTDYNLHDPGITFIELFAWLTEMEHYYLDRVRDENYLKFLKLLGVKPKAPSPARTNITFSSLDKSKKTAYIPGGTQLTGGNVVFETCEGIEVLNADIIKIVTCTRSGYIDNTGLNAHSGITYYAFGEKPEVSDILYLGFETAENGRPFPKNRQISLIVSLFEDYPDSGSREIDFIPSAMLEWQYYGKDWLKAKVIRDETNSLYRSGRLIFEIPCEMERKSFYFGGDKEIFWLRCVLMRGAYELAPRIHNIMINTVPALEGETLCETLSYKSNGKAGQSLELLTYLAQAGTNIVQVMEQDKRWRYWNPVCSLSDSGPDSCFVISKSKRARIYFGNGRKGRIPEKGQGNIRIISHVSPLKEMKSTALPNQVMKLGTRSVIPENFMLQVEEEIDGNYYWVDWDMVDDFAASGPEDRHYVLDADAGEVLFGDGVNGLIPHSSRNDHCNIRVISCRIGGGEAGNVKSNTLLSGCENLSAVNLSPAYGGHEKEDIIKAQIRARKDMKTLYRAVTVEDYEKLTLKTPGLRVARAKAIPLFETGLKNYPEETALGVMTVIAVPYSNCIKPVPSREFMANIKQHLNRHRLITTEVHVIPPEYIEVSVYAAVVFKPEIIPDARRVESELKSFLCPVRSAGNNDGWPFGRAVYKSEVYEAIEKIEGVDYVEEVRLFASGQNFKIDDRGNIHIGPASLVCSGEHRIEALGSMGVRHE